MKVHYSESLLESSRLVAEKIVAVSQQAIRARGVFSFVLAGGKTPGTVYSLLSAPPFSKGIDWHNTHIFFGDERMVPPDSDMSNFRMADTLLLQKIPVPDEQIHRIRGESTMAREAGRYCSEIATFFEKYRGSDSRFDVVLLGIGEDGHTASLFPKNQKNEDGGPLVVSVSPPSGTKPAVDRISLTLKTINMARNICFLVHGEKKKSSLDQVFASGGLRYPAARVKGDTTLWYLSGMGNDNIPLK